MKTFLVVNLIVKHNLEYSNYSIIFRFFLNNILNILQSRLVFKPNKSGRKQGCIILPLKHDSRSSQQAASELPQTQTFRLRRRQIITNTCSPDGGAGLQGDESWRSQSERNTQTEREIEILQLLALGRPADGRQE